MRPFANYLGHLLLLDLAYYRHSDHHGYHYDYPVCTVLILLLLVVLVVINSGIFR